MSPLADAVYALLRGRVPGTAARITYDDLATQLPPAFSDVQAYDVRLWQALGEIVEECRRRHLPALSAIVVRGDTGTPGHGYFEAAHPDIVGDDVQEAIAWGNEVTPVMRTTYPPRI